MVQVKIYVGHATGWNFEEKLYQPLEDSALADKHELVFPHDSEEFFNSKKFLREECDVFIAEVSRDSTGLGIELGWAEEFDVPVMCAHMKDSEVSRALEVVTGKILEYENSRELVEIVEEAVSEMS